MPKPEQGRIVLVEVNDPQKRNAKARPAVIVSRTDEIEAEDVMFCVAVTSRFPDQLPEDCVLLPFHPGGKTRTGLRKRSAAKCSWLFEIEERAIEKYVGVTPPKQLQQILEMVEKLKSR